MSENRPPGGKTPENAVQNNAIHDEDFRDLQAAWQEPEAPESPTTENDVISAKDKNMLVHELHLMKSKQSSMIRRRDLVENLAAVFVIIFFGRWAISVPDRAQQVGATVVVLGAVVVIAVMWFGRRLFKEADMAATPREACALQLQAVERQQRMLRWVPVWYIGPVGVGVVCIAFATMEGMGLVCYLIFCAILFIGIAYMNARAATKTLQPEIEKLSEMLRDLGQPNADETEE